MQKTAIALRATATSKDAAKLAAAGDHLQGICAGCHAKYRPAEPSDGLARYPFYPKRELAKWRDPESWAPRFDVLVQNLFARTYAKSIPCGLTCEPQRAYPRIRHRREGNVLCKKLRCS